MSCTGFFGVVCHSNKAAINALHEKGFVFGDLRWPNIMVLNGRAKILDFDWCGNDGEDRYPATLNDLGDINWHQDVHRGSIMRKEHDCFMLEGLHSTGLAEVVEKPE